MKGFLTLKRTRDGGLTDRYGWRFLRVAGLLSAAFMGIGCCANGYRFYLAGYWLHPNLTTITATIWFIVMGMMLAQFLKPSKRVTGMMGGLACACIIARIILNYIHLGIYTSLQSLDIPWFYVVFLFVILISVCLGAYIQNEFGVGLYRERKVKGALIALVTMIGLIVLIGCLKTLELCTFVRSSIHSFNILASIFIPLSVAVLFRSRVAYRMTRPLAVKFVLACRRHTMKKIIFLLICCCCVSFNINAQWRKKYVPEDESKRIPSEWSYIYDAGDKSILFTESGTLMIVAQEQLFLSENGGVPVSIEMFENGNPIKKEKFAFTILPDRHGCGLSSGFKDLLDSIRTNGAVIRVVAPLYDDSGFDVTTTRMYEKVILHQLSSTAGQAKMVCDTVPQKPDKIADIKRPRLLGSVEELGFKYNELFGHMSRYSDPKPDILKDLPPLKGLKYKTYTISCERDSCITSRSIIAVRCPKDSVLLRWVCKSIEEWDTLSKGSLSDQESLRSSGEIVTYYINKVKERGSIVCEGDIGWKSFEQSGCLVTDIWHHKDLCTLFTSYWRDSGCVVRTFESWRTVNTITGKAYSLFDFIDIRDEAVLIDLIVKYLWNHHDRWIDLYPDRFQEHPEWLKDCSGAALTKNGLIVYYHAPEIGCYADGQFNAVIPYEELEALPHGLLMDIQ